MKLLVIFLLLVSMFQVNAQEAWTQLNDFPFETQSRDSFIFQGEAYILTGNYGDGSDDDIYRYNLESDSWTLITTIPSNYAAPFVINDLVYFLAYQNDTSLALWEYDLLNNIWEQKEDADDTWVTFFGEYKPHTFVIDNIAYMVLPADITDENDGVTAKKYIASEDIWEPVASYIANFDSRVSSFVAAGKGYTIYGFRDKDGESNAMYAYDPVLDIWEQKADAPYDFLEFPIILPINNAVYLGGGNIIGAPNRFFHRYDIESDTWEQVEDPNYSVDRAFDFVIDGKGYFGTGRFFNPDSGDGYLDRQSVYRLEPEFLSVREVSKPTTKLFPNPTKNVIELSNLAPKSSLYLYDLLGKSLPISLISDTKMETSHLAPGMYFLSISSPQGSQTLKFVKK